MIAAALFGALLWWRGTLFETRWYLRVMAHMLVDRLRRGDCRLGRHRERPPALDRARHPAHRRRDLAGAGRERCRRRWCCSSSSTASCSAMGIYYINRLIARGPQGVAVEAPARFSAESDLPPRRTPAREALTAADGGRRHGMVSPGDLGRADRHRGRACTSSSTASISASASCFRSPSSESERDQMIALDRAVLGRQRDLAGARRRRVCWSRSRRPMRSIMPALYLPVIVMLLALVFRGVAFEFRTVSTQQEMLELRLRRRLDARGVLPGRDPRRADSGHHGRERRLCRRRVRLGDAVRAAVRARRGRRLRAARRHLAGDEDRRRGRRARARAGQDAAARRARLHGAS